MYLLIFKDGTGYKQVSSLSPEHIDLMTNNVVEVVIYNNKENRFYNYEFIDKNYTKTKVPCEEDYMYAVDIKCSSKHDTLIEAEIGRVADECAFYNGTRTLSFRYNDRDSADEVFKKLREFNPDFEISITDYKSLLVDVIKHEKN